MSRALIQKLNRTVTTFESGVPISTSAVAVDMKIDPSQQYKISGFSAAYVFNTAADATAVTSGYVVGYLDYVGNFAGDVIDSVFADPTLGEIIAFGFVSRVLIGGLSLYCEVNYDEPMIINGDRRMTFILAPPQAAGAAGNARLYLTVRGEVTQMEDQDKPRLGPWTLRG